MSVSSMHSTPAKRSKQEYVRYEFIGHITDVTSRLRYEFTECDATKYSS